MKLGQGNVFTGVCDSVHSGGSASVHAGIPNPPRADPPKSRPPRSIPPGADPPWEQTPPEQIPPGTDPPRADSPRSRPPSGKQTPAYGQRAPGTHPTGMHSCYYYYYFKICSQYISRIRVLETIVAVNVFDNREQALFWNCYFVDCWFEINRFYTYL